MALSIRTAPAATRAMLVAIAALSVCLSIALVANWAERRATAQPDEPVETAAPPSIQTSYTYTAALAKLVAPSCGAISTGAIDAAAADEGSGAPDLVARAMAEAGLRAETITTGKSCRYAVNEILLVERRAERAGY